MLSELIIHCITEKKPSNKVKEKKIKHNRNFEHTYDCYRKQLIVLFGWVNQKMLIFVY